MLASAQYKAPAVNYERLGMRGMLLRDHELSFLDFVANRGGYFTRLTVSRWFGVGDSTARKRIRRLLAHGVGRTIEANLAAPSVYRVSADVFPTLAGMGTWLAAERNYFAQLEVLTVATAFAGDARHRVLRRSERILHLVRNGLPRDLVPMTTRSPRRDGGMTEGLDDELVVDNETGRTYVLFVTGRDPEPSTAWDEWFMERWSPALATGRGLGVMVLACTNRAAQFFHMLYPSGRVQVEGAAEMSAIMPSSGADELNVHEYMRMRRSGYQGPIEQSGAVGKKGARRRPKMVEADVMVVQFTKVFDVYAPM